MEHKVFIDKYLARLDAAGIPQKVSRRTDWTLLHPKVVPGFLILANRLLDAYQSGELSQYYLAFEGYRNPLEQVSLMKRGVSKAPPWKSAHNYGMAIDWVGWNPKASWNWKPADDQDWKIIGLIAVNNGLLRPITWDKPHVEHPVWFAIKRTVLE